MSGLGAALLLAGCAQFVVPKPPPPDPAGNFAPLTLPVIALGDTQEHEATGFPLHENDGAVDSYVEVAQRPPEQPLFGRRILEWVLAAHRDEPVLHLGDVLDMSCASELRRIGTVFNRAHQPAAILPGNHDGLMFGIFNQPLARKLLDDAGKAWYRGCVRGARDAGDTERIDPRQVAVDKRRFIAAYLSALANGARRVEGLAVPPATGEARVSWRNPRPGAYLEAIEARLLDELSYANSFVVQKLRLPAAPGAKRRVTMIGFDTNQVDFLVGTLHALRSISPGDIGHVRADQLDAIRPWLEEARRAGDIVVFAGHHNWNHLSFGSQARIGALIERLDHPLVYISAHTHKGYWAMHRLGGRDLLELNVSSLSDWPISYRRLSFALDERARRLKVTAEIMPNLGQPPGDDGQLMQAWHKATCERASYTPYAAELESRLVVEAQRAARGTLMDWLLEGLGEWCRPCLRGLYESGLRYQDVLLETIDQFYADFKDVSPEVRGMPTPPLCRGRDVANCIGDLFAEQASDLDSAMGLFRKKAQFIDTMNQAFDDLLDSRVHAYMACRAVISANVDFALTPEENRSERGESGRRRMDFFRIEATVGMD